MSRLTIATLVVCQSTQSLIIGGVSLFLPLIRADLDISFAQAGTLAAATSLCYALMQLPSGYLADRFTPRRLFLIGLVGTNALALSFALLTDYHLMLANQALSGVFRALVFAPGLLLVSAEFPPTGRATAMGLFVAGGFSSNILLSATGPLLVGTLGWRALFAVFAAAGLAMCVLYWRTGGPGPTRTGPRMSLRELPGLLRHPILWQTGAIQFVRLAVVTGCTFWLPTYLVADRGYSLATAGLVTALGALVTAPANIAGGYLSDRLGRPMTVVRTSLVALAVTLTLLVALPGQWAVVVVVAVNAVFIQVYFGPLFAIPVAHLGTRTAGVASGFGNLCANIGGFACSYGFGVLRDATGSFRPGFLTLAVLCVLAVALSTAIRPAPLPDGEP
jgi:MFS transporter, ACS family, D-galactonate transporter